MLLRNKIVVPYYFMNKELDMSESTQTTSVFSHGLYDPSNEHDACGVGFVAHIKGLKSHAIVSQALKILENLDHRGAVGARSATPRHSARRREAVEAAAPRVAAVTAKLIAIVANLTTVEDPISTQHVVWRSVG